MSKRSKNPIFMLFRLILSLTMFGVLILGGYSAYKHFSGVDPLKFDLGILSTLKLPNELSSKIILPSPDEKDEVHNQSAALFKFLVVADTHNDNKNLAKALRQAQGHDSLSFIIGLGDYTEIGTLPELRAAKIKLDSSSLRYFVVAGDHDLWESRDKQLDPKTNFREVFGSSYQSFDYQDFKFILIDNSDNYKGISLEQSAWIKEELNKGKEMKGTLVFLHEPLYHPSSDHAMGKVEKSLKSQAESLIYQFKEAKVKAIFAGDIHYYSEYNEPVTNIAMYTIGAVVTERNPQTPRYAVVTVYEDGSIEVDDTEIK